MEQQILNTILQNTYSLSQLKHRLNILKTNLQQNLFALKNQQIEQKDLLWLKSLPPEFFQKFNIDNAYDIFTKLEKAILNIKTLTIYLTFEPDDDSLTQIGQRVRTLFGNMLLDIKYDPNLIAGTALVWKGIYQDYSLHARIQDRKDQVLDSFKEYLRK